jgi:hypothetical protein
MLDGALLCLGTWHYFGPGRVGPGYEKARLSILRPRPGLIVGPPFPAQARPIGLKYHRVVGPGLH